MSFEFKVRDEAYYDDGSGRGRVPCIILELPFVNEAFTIRLDSGIVKEATLSQLDIESQADVLETAIYMLKSEKLEKENKIYSLEEKLAKERFDNVIKDIKDKGYRESFIRKDIDNLFKTRLFAFGFELESVIPYSTERYWNGKMTKMNYRLDFVMCVFDEVVPILTDLRFLTKLDSKLIEQFEFESWNSPDLLECLCKQEELSNKTLYCSLENKMISIKD